MNLASHLKAGFTNRWNLLIFFAASAFALISGRADVVLPLVLAGEVAYLGLVARRESDRDAPRDSLRDLSHPGIGDQEPEKIAEQVESVTASVKETEQTISRIDFDVPLDPKALDLLGPISFDDDSGAEDEQYFVFEDDD